MAAIIGGGRTGGRGGGLNVTADSAAHYKPDHCKLKRLRVCWNGGGGMCTQVRQCAVRRTAAAVAAADQMYTTPETVVLQNSRRHAQK